MTTQPQSEELGFSCTLAGPGRGDCEHFIGLPGKSIPGQHDGPDDAVDVYGKPNGWCWTCWRSYQIVLLRKERDELKMKLAEAGLPSSAQIQDAFALARLEREREEALANLNAQEALVCELEAKCAGMRESLEKVLDVADLIDDETGHQSQHIKHALSGDCGKGFVRLSEIFDDRSPWSLLETMKASVLGVRHLFMNHDCDCHGWEHWSESQLQMGRHIERLEALKAK